MDMTGKADIAKLLDATPQLWRGRRFSQGQKTLPTGHARLDARLPGGGWPLGAVSEIIAASPGLGEFSLLFPVLAELGGRGQWVVLVDPPWIPYPGSLRAQGLRLERLLLIRTRDERDSLWACEQALCSGRGGAVLAWPQRVGFARLRRLQLAAEAGAKLAFLFRPESTLRKRPGGLRAMEAGGRRTQRSGAQVPRQPVANPSFPAFLLGSTGPNSHMLWLALIPAPGLDL
jgi:hypothetical protein